MAAWGSLKNIFENPLPDSLSSWNQLLPQATTTTSFEMFGELCHQVNPQQPPNSPPNSHSHPHPIPKLSLPGQSSHQCGKKSSWNDTMSEPDENAFEIFGELCYKLKPEAPCNETGGDEGTRVLQSQSWGEPTKNLKPGNSGDADEGVNEDAKGGGDRGKNVMYTRSYSDVRTKNNGLLFPPPITSIGKCGKPRVYFKSYRKDGRFVLREIRIPTQQILQATREDGRLRMQVVRHDEDIAGKGEEGREEEERAEEEEEKGLIMGSISP